MAPDTRLPVLKQGMLKKLHPGHKTIHEFASGRRRMQAKPKTPMMNQTEESSKQSKPQVLWKNRTISCGQRSEN